ATVTGVQTCALPIWPRSRARTPKQLLSIVGEQTMLQQTAERLAPLFTASRIWVVTSDQQAPAVRRQLPHLRRGQILTEPVGRNRSEERRVGKGGGGG